MDSIQHKQIKKEKLVQAKTPLDNTSFDIGALNHFALNMETRPGVSGANELQPFFVWGLEFHTSKKQTNKQTRVRGRWCNLITL